MEEVDAKKQEERPALPEGTAPLGTKHTNDDQKAPPQLLFPPSDLYAVERPWEPRPPERQPKALPFVSHLKVLTYNVMAPPTVRLEGGGSEVDLVDNWVLRNRKAATVIEYHLPDVACLQEYWCDQRCHALYNDRLFNDYEFCLSTRVPPVDEDIEEDELGRPGPVGLATVVSKKSGWKVMEQAVLSSGGPPAAREAAEAEQKAAETEQQQQQQQQQAPVASTDDDAEEGKVAIDPDLLGDSIDNGVLAFAVMVDKVTDTHRPDETAVAFPVLIVNTFLPDPADAGFDTTGQRSMSRFPGGVNSSGGGGGGGRGGGGLDDSDSLASSRPSTAAEAAAAACATVDRTWRARRRRQAEALVKRIDAYLEKTRLLEVPVLVTGGFHGSFDNVYRAMEEGQGRGGFASCFAAVHGGREVEVTHRTSDGRHVAADFIWQRRQALRCREDAQNIRGELDIIAEMKERSEKRLQWEHMIRGGSRKKGPMSVAQRRAAAERKRGMIARQKREKAAILERRTQFAEQMAKNSSVSLRLVPATAYTLPRHSTDYEPLVEPLLQLDPMDVGGPSSLGGGYADDDDRDPRVAHHRRASDARREAKVGWAADLQACCSPDGLSQWSDVSDHRPVVVEFTLFPGCRLDAACQIQAQIRGRLQRKRFASQLSSKRAKDAMAAYKSMQRK